MYCTSCGKEIEESAKYCTHCGAPVEQEYLSDTSAEQPTVVMPQNQPTEPLEPPASSSQQSQEGNSVSAAQQSQESDFVTTPQPPQGTAKMNAAQKKPLSKNAKIGIGVGIGVAVLAIIVAVVFIVTNLNQPQEEQPSETDARVTIIDETDEEQAKNTEEGEADDTEENSADSSIEESAGKKGELAYSNDAQDMLGTGTISESSIDDFAVFTNARYGYSFAYPEDFVPLDVSANGDGLTLASDSTGTIRIEAWGTNNVFDETASDRLKEMEDSIGIEGYTASGNTWYVYSYNTNGRVIYMKEYVGEGSIVNLTISYPESSSEFGDRLVEIMETSFDPGDISESH